MVRGKIRKGGGGLQQPPLLRERVKEAVVKLMRFSLRLTIDKINANKSQVSKGIIITDKTRMIIL